MPKSAVYLWSAAMGIILLVALLWIHPILSRSEFDKRLQLEREIVKRRGLTDISLFTEASYLRNPTLADRFAPFQNHPMARSHFPSESLLSPPSHLVDVYGQKTMGGLP